METPQTTYNPDELKSIVDVLRDSTQPEEILLFGSLAGAEPFSRIAAYDLLVVTANRSPAEWDDIRSLLKFRIPGRSRTIPFINLYLCSPKEADGGMSLFYRFIHQACRPLYSRRTFKPRHREYDYEKLYFEAADRCGFFTGQAEGFLQAAGQGAAAGNWRQAAFQTACGAEMLLHALYAAYHASDIEEHKLTTLFLRMRTLSPELFLLLDPERSCASRILSRLDGWRRQAIYDPACNTDKTEIGEYLARIREMQHLIGKLTTERLRLYKERI